jgi:pilus assembly protein Flp/PilA
MRKFINMLRDKRGASAAEYALILAIIGAAIAVAALALSGAMVVSSYVPPKGPAGLNRR